MRFMTSKKIRHYLQFKDFSRDDYDYVLERARILKRKFKNYETYHPLHDRTLAMIFEKNSTRTRLSFEAGIFQLGGHAVFLSTRDTQLGRDVALKILPPNYSFDQDQLRRFEQEACAAGVLRDPFGQRKAVRDAGAGQRLLPAVSFSTLCISPIFGSVPVSQPFAIS